MHCDSSSIHWFPNTECTEIKNTINIVNISMKVLALSLACLILGFGISSLEKTVILPLQSSLELLPGNLNNRTQMQTVETEQIYTSIIY